MLSGSLRYTATLQDVAAAQNDFGETVPTWPTVATFACDMADLYGTELFRVQKIDAQASVKVICRYRLGVRPRMRLLVNERVLEVVTSSNPDGRKRQLVIMCKEAT